MKAAVLRDLNESPRWTSAKRRPRVVLISGYLAAMASANSMAWGHLGVIFLGFKGRVYCTGNLRLVRGRCCLWSVLRHLRGRSWLSPYPGIFCAGSRLRCPANFFDPIRDRSVRGVCSFGRLQYAVPRAARTSDRRLVYQSVCGRTPWTLGGTEGECVRRLGA